MTPHGSTAFALSGTLAYKADPALIDRDEQQFAAIRATIDAQRAEAQRRLAELRLEDADAGQVAVERDQTIRRIANQLHVLDRFGIDLCIGRIVRDGAATPNPTPNTPTPTALGTDPLYIGRVNLRDENGRTLLVDWRAPAAEPFFSATHAHPMGLVSRRRYRWANGAVIDYWDEAFTAEAQENGAALDDQSSFIASLGTARTEQMRDVLSTIQNDQDAIIRAEPQTALVVDGGPGTGKTVVALHRAAYLMYSDTRISRDGGGVLYIGPNEAYLRYVDDVLPSLGEDNVHMCTLRDLVPEGAAAAPEADPHVADLKASIALADAIDRAVAFYEEPPTGDLRVDTPWGALTVSGDDWADAFGVVGRGTPHNEARPIVWGALVEILSAQVDASVTFPELRRFLRTSTTLTGAFNKAWRTLDPAQVVADLWTVPAYLRHSAPGLSPDEVRALQRPDGSAWTLADLPLIDAARSRTGDPNAERIQRQRDAALGEARRQMERVVDDLAAGDDSELLLMTMLKSADVRNSLIDDSALPELATAAGDGPFAHIIVDEAQELTDAEWLMLLRRCPSHSFTIVGDRAQARHGFTETWQQRLQRVGLGDIAVATLSINYRTPEEIMVEAEPVIRAAIPEANVPTSIRRSGVPVERGDVADLDAIIGRWMRENAEGTACVIGLPGYTPGPRVQSLSPVQSKGLEFDLVVLVEPERFGDGVMGAVDRYVAMTRATRRLVVLEG